MLRYDPTKDPVILMLDEIRTRLNQMCNEMRQKANESIRKSDERLARIHVKRVELQTKCLIQNHYSN